MSKTDTESIPRTPFLMSDGLIILAGFAFALNIVRIELTPPYGRLLSYREGTSLWDINIWSRRGGISTLLWHLLLGPTIAGPVLIWRHMQTLVRWSLLPGRFLWMIIGMTTGLQTLLTYDVRLVAADIEPPYGPYMLFGGLMEILTTLAYPVLVAVVFLGLLSKKRRLALRTSGTWLDTTGMIVGVLWMVQSGLQIYTYNQNWVTYWP